MSKRLILILALAFVVGITFAAYAEVQNVKVSGDIQVQGVARKALTLNDDNTPAANFGESISAILSQVRVRVDADLTDNVSTTVRLLNERVWGEEAAGSANSTSNSTGVDIDLAFATVKEFLYSPLTLTLGRQGLRFGNALVIGDPDTNAIAADYANATRVLPKSLADLSLRKAFDAVRATLNYDPLVVDLLYSKIDENGVATADDTDLFGANASYAVNKDLNTEVYLYQRSRKSSQPAGTGATTPRDKEKLMTAGARATYAGIENLSLGLESAFQFGDHLAEQDVYPDEALDNDSMREVKAFALQAEVNYVLPRLKKYSPVIGAGYTYLSGDEYKSRGNNYKGWDPMFEDQNGGTLFNKIFALTNLQILNLNANLKPMEDVKVALNYYYLRFVQPVTDVDTTVTLSGIASDPTYQMVAAKKSLGSEIDLGITYDYTEDVQFGLNAGTFIPGTAFSKGGGTLANNRRTAGQVIGSMKVTF